MSLLIPDSRRRSWAALWLVALISLLFSDLTAAQRRRDRQAELPTAPLSASPTGEYLIGPGDTLNIFVWRQPDLSVTVPVRPDGRVSTPLVEDLIAVGKTPTQLATEIEQALSEYVRAPEVNVIVQDFVGTFGAQIRVLGQATRPSSIPYRERMTLLDVVIEVGGLTEFAAGNRSRLIRLVDGKSQEIRVKLDDLINKGKIEQNMLMQPGDVLLIPEAAF
jgi:polysaccharide export outer membrane protein